MKLLIPPVFLCLIVGAPAFAQTNDSIQPTDTNLIAFCASKSDVAAHVKVLSKAFIRKPLKPDGLPIVDLSVYGELVTLDVKRVFLAEHGATCFTTNIYLYKRGMLSVSFLEPTLQVGREYIVFLKRDKAPEIAKAGVVTVPPVPAINYFTFIRLPQRQTPDRKAYVEILNTNSLAAVDRCFSACNVASKKTKGPQAN